MDETKELLKASFERLEGLIGEVKELRYKVKDVKGDIDSLRSGLKGGNGNGGGDGGRQEAGGQKGNRQQGQGQQGGDDRLSQMEQRLNYLTQKYVDLDREIYMLKQKDGSVVH